MNAVPFLHLKRCIRPTDASVVRNIFKEGELEKEAAWATFAYTAIDGKVYNIDYYNLYVIISVG